MPKALSHSETRVFNRTLRILLLFGGISPPPNKKAFARELVPVNAFGLGKIGNGICPSIPRLFASAPSSALPRSPYIFKGLRFPLLNPHPKQEEVLKSGCDISYICGPSCSHEKPMLRPLASPLASFWCGIAQVWVPVPTLGSSQTLSWVDLEDPSIELLHFWELPWS